MKQKTRWSEEQLAVIKGSLAENDLAITGIRKVFLEDELTEQEEKAIDTAIRKNPAAQEVLTRHYCPELKVDAPVGQVQDRLAGIPVESLDPATATLHAAAVEMAEDCMRAHLEELFTGKPGASFKSLYKLDPENPNGTFIGLMARNRYIVDCEKLTHHLSLLAGKKDETPEETMERLRNDSAR